MKLKSRVKEILTAIGVLVVLAVVAVVGFKACRREAPAVPACAAGQVPAGWTVPPELKTPWLPFQHNEASEYTAEFPAGSSVVVLSSQDGGQIEIGILPDGTIVVPEGVNATVYKKRPPFVAAQFRPFVGIGAIGPELGVSAAAGADVLRVWKVNIGVGALINDDAVSAAAFGAYPIWRNVDVRGGGGYGTAGGVGFAGISIGIQ